MEDLTIIFFTVNRVPKDWAKYHLEKLYEAIGDTKIISVSIEPMDLGINIIQERTYRPGVYWYLLQAAKLATTPYVAVVDDDTLYPPDHFTHRPDMDTFAYNEHRWSLYTWNPIYSLKSFLTTNAVLIAPRELLIESLEERYRDHPYGPDLPEFMCREPGFFEKEYGGTPRKIKLFKSENAVVQLDHDYFTIYNEEKESVERRHKKRLGTVKALDIPYWGKATDIVERFK